MAMMAPAYAGNRRVVSGPNPFWRILAILALVLAVAAAGVVVWQAAKVAVVTGHLILQAAKVPVPSGRIAVRAGVAPSRAAAAWKATAVAGTEKFVKCIPDPKDSTGSFLQFIDNGERWGLWVNKPCTHLDPEGSKDPPREPGWNIQNLVRAAELGVKQKLIPEFFWRALQLLE